jgi:Cu2+-containing amine oxidase
LVDLNARKVVEVNVLDPVPISPKNRNLDPASIGNYDYLLDWVFTQDGCMRMAAGAIGILAPKGVSSISLSDGNIEQDRTYGELVEKLIAAPNHDHPLICANALESEVDILPH